MREHMAKYATAKRLETHRSIDMPMVIILGLTVGDLVAALSGFLAVTFVWDSLLAMPVAVIAGAALAQGSRLYRENLPRHFALHWAWSLGLLTAKRVPTLFGKRRFVTFGT